jgi:hypothetical protein
MGKANGVTLIDCMTRNVRERLQHCHGSGRKTNKLEIALDNFYSVCYLTGELIGWLIKSLIT